MLDFAGTGGARALADADGLRPYQEEAVAAGLERIASDQRVGILNTFTGSGKTRTAIALARRWLARTYDDRCLWIANRTVLIEDAIARLAKSLGIWISREQASSVASDTRVVVGSMQTLKGERLLKMDPESFGMIIVDECQYWDSDLGQAILAHFKRAKVIGLSATPGTGEVVYSRDVLWGIDEGYAVPLLPRFERLVELDISAIKSAKNSAGVKDLQIGALEEAVLKAAAPIADAVWKHCQDRHPIIYTPGVASAHAVAKILNDRAPGWIESVDAKTPPAERRRIQAAFDSGELRALVNCGIYLFGFDAPTCDAIVLARLTEDWGLWMQMLGRGIRPAPGIGELATREERVAAIAASHKPNMLLLDITGEHGKHVICSPTDIDRSLEKDVKVRAEKKLRDDPQTTVTDAIKEAKAWKRGEYDRLARLAALAKIKSESGTFDPFRAAGVNDRAAYKAHAPAWTKEPASLMQKMWLRGQHLPEDISKGEASKMRAQADKWMAEGKATYSQRLQLSKLGLPHDLPYQQAADLLYACPVAWVKGQRVRRAPSRDVVERVLIESSRNAKQGGAA
jgi:superfamily II DNA or RNA helicase